MRRAVLLAILVFSAIAVSAQTDDGIQKGYRYFDVSPGLRLWGAESDFELGFRIFDGVDTALWTRLSAAWGTPSYFRMGDGSIYYQPDFPGVDSSLTSYNRWNIHWGAGIEQGLHFDAAKKRNDLSLLLAYLGWWDDNLLSTQTSTLLYQSSVPDRAGNLTHSFLLDILYNGTRIDKDSKVISGPWLDASTELSPLGISTPAETGFIQFSASAKDFVPLYKKTNADGWNLFSIYLAGFVGVDFIKGLGSDKSSGIPFHVSQDFGGRTYRDGLGGSVRGLATGYLDGTFKAVGNLELRFNLPSLVLKDFVPGVLAYIDAGYYSNPPGIPTSSLFTQGFASGAGIGAYADLLDLAYVALYTNFLFTMKNYDGRWWNPITAEFSLHF